MTALFALFLLAGAAGATSPDERAAQIAAGIPHVVKAAAELRQQVALIAEPKLRAAVQERLATAAFWTAPGGPCPAVHHAYPGGLAVHSLANLLHALALARVYREVYGARLDDDWLRAAAAWHDSAKAETLRWHDDGGCGPEGMLAETQEHHVRGLAAAIKARLPAGLVVTIASAHAPPVKDNLGKICGWLQAASALATGAPDAVPCPDEQHPAPLEAFVTNLADVDYAGMGAASAAAVGQGAGWERFAPLFTASELQLWPRGAK